MKPNGAWAPLAFALLLGGCAGHPRAAPEKGRGRTIVLLTIDLLRADHLQCYGYPRRTSPNIDRLAERSVLFEQAFSHSPNTLPEDVSLLTSLYPRSHGVWVKERDRLREGIPTLDGTLRGAGYKTMELRVYPPEAGRQFREFDDWMSGAAPGDDVFVRANLGDLHDPYFPEKNLFSDAPRLDPARYWPEVFDYTKEFLGQSEDGRRYLEAHGEFFKTPFAMERIPELDRILESMPPYYGVNIKHALFWKHFQGSRPEDVEYVQTLYDSLLVEADRYVGELLSLLERRGRLGGAIVLLTAQHGEAFMEHGFFQHGDIYPECVHVPLLVSGPGLSPRRVRDLAQHIDVMPTLLDLARVPAPAGMQGRSLRPLLERGGRARGWGGRAAFSEWRGSRAVRTEHWTYIRREGGSPDELYERGRDPLERVDVSRRFPERLAELRRRLSEFEAAHPPAAITGELPPGLSPEIKAHILKTGYW